MTGNIGGTIFDQYWSEEHGEIKYQILEGCEIDQVVAQWHANLYGLGDIFEPHQFSSAVRAIWTHNFKPRLGDVPNPCRVFGMEEEAGTLMCAWPAGSARPAIPIPYSQETMHGFEYAFGTQLMMIGEFAKGFQVFAAVRDRYRGHNRNPWNEIECGSNYARSMSSYAAIPVLSGFSFNAANAQMGFAPKVQRRGIFRSIWSNGTAWGMIEVGRGAARLNVRAGNLSLAELNICGLSFRAPELAAELGVQCHGDRFSVGTDTTLTVKDGRIDLSTCHDIENNTNPA